MSPIGRGGLVLTSDEPVSADEVDYSFQESRVTSN